MLTKYDGFIFDLDGTIYVGDKLIPKAAEVINHLKKSNKKIIFITNKTTGTVKQYCDFLTKNKLNVTEEEIINSTIVTKKYLGEKHPGAKFYAIGEEVFISEIENAGLQFSKEPNEIRIVIITLDRTLDYSKLEIAARALDNGARFYAANIDDTCPVEGGEIWDAGSTISALEKRTHFKLEKHFGKPSKFMMNEILNKLNIPSEKCLLIGDRVETDIAMGNSFGIDTALVSTGVFNHFDGNE
ncbi:MAG: HAD-IIA family hydrolase, partial [Melioribacteraceae bacterium]